MAPESNQNNGSDSALKKRVLFIITQAEAGGAQRFLYNLILRIRHKYDVQVAVGSDGQKDLAEKMNSLNVPIRILKFLKREISPRDDIKACYEVRKMIKDFRPNDIFLLSSKAGFIGALATIFPFKLKPMPRVIYRIGGWTFNDPWPTWKKRLWIKLEKLSAGWKDVIIVNNKHDLNQADKLGIKPRKQLILIHNGIDPYKLEFLSKDEARIKIFEKISKNYGNIFRTNILIGTVANLYPTKGIKFLIEAAEHFKNNDDVAFVVIGEGSEREELEKNIKDKKLEKKIFLIGQIRDGYKLIPAFDIFILPSVKEGFPWALIEAMAAKLPVIATRVGAVPEIVDNGKNGLIVEPGNSAALAGKIKELIASDYLFKELPIQGHQTVLFNFSEDKMIKEIEGLL